MHSEMQPHAHPPYQSSSALISAHQSSSELIRAHQRSSELIRAHQRPAERPPSAAIISGHQRPSAAIISGHHQRPSAAISGHHQWPSSAAISGPPSGLICERSQTCRALSSSLIDGLIE